MSKPNLILEVLTGTGSETIDVPSQYRASQITIIGISTGKVLIEVKAVGSMTFESLINGEMNVAFDRTLTVFNQVEAFRFTYSNGAPYTVQIKLTDGNTER